MIETSTVRNASAIVDPPVASAEDIVEWYERLSVAEHPLFVSLGRNPVDLRTIWLLMANLREGISGHFVRWLARTIERVDDRRIASFIARQLNDELGDGDPLRIHSVLLDRFVEGLGRWRPAPFDEGMLEPGRRLAAVGAEPFVAPDVHESLGALIVGEIFAKKMDRCLGEEVRRQNLVADEALTWLHIHEVLEVDHADEVADLARLLPRSRGPLGAAWNGAVHQWEALWTFLLDIESLRLRHAASRALG